MNQEVAIAALFVACKIEETHKKSRELLCIAWNLKSTSNEKSTPDDKVRRSGSAAKVALLMCSKIFDKPSAIVIGVERIMLETSAFDFRTRYPHKLIAKVLRAYNISRRQPDVAKAAFYMGTDAYRTWASMKHIPISIALACVELAGRLYDSPVEQIERARDYDGHGKFAAVERPMVMGKPNPL